MTESYAMYARNGCVVVRVIDDGLELQDILEIPFKRTVALHFQDVNNGGATVEVDWQPGKLVAVRLRFPVGRRKLSFLKKKARLLTEYFEIFGFAEDITVFQMQPPLCK